MPATRVINDPAVLEALSELELMTVEMREHAAGIERLGRARRRLIRRLRNRNVTFRAIAEACGISEQAVYSDLRKGDLSAALVLNPT